MRAVKLRVDTGNLSMRGRKSALRACRCYRRWDAVRIFRNNCMQDLTACSADVSFAGVPDQGRVARSTQPNGPKRECHDLLEGERVQKRSMY